MSACLDENQLLALAEGSAAPGLLAQVDAHVDGCEPCRRAVASVMRRDDGRSDYPALLEVDAQHYVFAQEFARGGMGRIRIAHDRRLGRAVAVKEMLATGPEAATRFEREARITARLQHPSIVNLYEAGVWPSGEPFYAMQLIRGRSLHEVIDATKSFEERIALLPNVLAVADAMASAHAARVVHRDLKPRNVLVGVFGETVVIDWGLAKDLTREELDEGPKTSSARLGSIDTEQGSVIGTPAYMPPEQANGLAVDERADVYAIGAMLDHVLSGRPPYTGTNAEVLAAVRAGAPVALSVRQPGLAPDLLGVVERAMVRDPAGRYPSARELAEDLRRYLTGQLVGAHHYSATQLFSRWLRRHRPAVSVAVVAASVLLTVGALALESVIGAREQAETQRARAEDLVGFMLVDLRERLKPIGKLEILDAVTRKAVGYYEQQDEGLGDDQLGRQGVARRSLGDVLQAQGQTAEAAREFRAALAIAHERHTRAPADVALTRELVASQQRVAAVLRGEGDIAAATVLSVESLRFSESLVERDPADDLSLRLLGISRINLGDLRRTDGDSAGALEEYRAALATADELAARSPSSVHRGDLALSHERIGIMMRDRGDEQAAQSSFEAALAIRRQLVADDPFDAWSRGGLSFGLFNVADGLLLRGDTAGALRGYREVLALRERLLHDDPTNAERKRDLCSARDKVATVLTNQGELTAALELFKASLGSRRQLADADPKSAARQQDLAISLSDVGDVLFAKGDVAEALEMYRGALVISQKLVAREPSNTVWQRSLLVDHHHLGNALLAQGDFPGALEAFRACIAIGESLTARDPMNLTWQQDLSNGQENLGDVLLAQGDGAGALERYRKALVTSEMLATRNPDNADWQADLGTLHESAGDALVKLGKKPAARDEYGLSLQIFRKLSAKGPAEPQWAARAKELEVKASK